MRRDEARIRAEVAADHDMTLEQKNFQIKTSTDSAIAFRVSNNRHRFWRYCDAKPCVRARSCRGDPYACLDRHRDKISPAAKAYERFYFEAMEGGISREEAMRIADARFAAWREHVAQVARILQARGRAAVAPNESNPAAPMEPHGHDAPEPHGPRIGTL
jgi:hypothetical protein